jgi:hypothetical protein
MNYFIIGIAGWAALTMGVPVLANMVALRKWKKPIADATNAARTRAEQENRRGARALAPCAWCGAVNVEFACFCRGCGNSLSDENCQRTPG